ncbi:calcium incorporation protein MxaA [Aquabacterium sp.]|uniref:calcium incorporation protein MxaA n=1 Tax=Aquabacterium sp. TaxID=1872578 RepID=UPI002BD4EEE1|nr:calcium incorporation protein MxaA [Aquabacterium sp.]HSW06555.1 calcium incorporation protein MxaA [Aquabacterium sp.]
MSRWRRVVLVAVLAGSSVARADAVAPTLQQPRAFGHLLGDVLTQRLPIGSDELAAVPPAGRIGAWLDRRAPRIETDAAGLRWLLVDYQVVNVPRTLATVQLPALTLKARSGATWALPGWPISIGPLIPDDEAAPGDLPHLRPDRPLADRPTAPARQRLHAALGALALTLLAWLGWWLWRHQREAVRLPFARAWRELRRFDRAALAAEPDAWRCLHRALADTAGSAAQAATLAGLLARAPQLRPLQPQLEDFYRCSSERFFAAVPKPATVPLRDLCRALRDVEKRQHGGA